MFLAPCVSLGNGKIRSEEVGGESSEHRGEKFSKLAWETVFIKYLLCAQSHGRNMSQCPEAAMEQCWVTEG